jgi:hypothetical protein
LEKWSLSIEDFGLRFDEGRKAQGTRHTAVKTFFPCAVSLEPHASLANDYWLQAALIHQMAKSSKS